jgi:hypothetical protein
MHKQLYTIRFALNGLNHCPDRISRENNEVESSREIGMQMVESQVWKSRGK